MKKYVILALLLFGSKGFADTSDQKIIAVLMAKNQALSELISKLEKRVKDLEDIKLPAALQAANQADAKAVGAKSAADSAQKSAERTTSTVLSGTFEMLSNEHGGCLVSDFSSPNCHAAGHRLCRKNGFVSGVVVESDFGSNNFVLACFR